uniref:Uncharacterized protein n=1 Tax=Spironucleus salmonicida TaxID=348837 RepID=V6LNW1_9EUKA|eukprot:EST45406.1 Hypothetical protein SS50377_14682 [Spironucleus salmonicida]
MEQNYLCNRSFLFARNLEAQSNFYILLFGRNFFRDVISRFNQEVEARKFMTVVTVSVNGQKSLITEVYDLLVTDPKK